MSNQPTTKELNEALRIRKKIDALEKETASLQQQLDRTLGSAPTRKKATAKKKRPRRAKTSARKVVRKKKVAKKTAKKKTAKKAPAPKLKDVIAQVLTQAKRPLNLDEIIAGVKKKGVKIKSKNPKHSLGVRMYSDKTFKKTKPGYFTVAR